MERKYLRHSTAQGYKKAIFSDRQGTWKNFRQAVIDLEGFEGLEKGACKK